MDYKVIYDHADNADFKKKRPDPNLILVGDRIVIPDLTPGKSACATGATHTFTAKKMKRKLTVRVIDSDGNPVKAAAYKLKLGELVIEGKSDGDGNVKADIPIDAEEGAVEVGAWKWPLRVGHLNPMEETGDDISGVQSRLLNLGHGPGAVDGVMGKKTSAAIRAFQRDQGLEVDGEISPDLVSKLKEVYGC